MVNQNSGSNPTRGSLVLGRQPDIRPYRGKRPQIAASAYIDPAAVIIGDVVIGEDSSVWPCTVIRGDVHYIRIGARTNIQDGSRAARHARRVPAHPRRRRHHRPLRHAARLHHRVALPHRHGRDHSERRDTSAPAASSPPARSSSKRTKIPPGSLVVGHPGKVKRALTGIDQATHRRLRPALRRVQKYLQKRSDEWRVTTKLYKLSFRA